VLRKRWPPSNPAHRGLGRSGPSPCALGRRGEADAALAKGARLGADHPASARHAGSDCADDQDRPRGPLSNWTHHRSPSLAKAFEASEEELDSPSLQSGRFQSLSSRSSRRKEDTHVLLQLAELAIEAGIRRWVSSVRTGDRAGSRNADAWTGKGVGLATARAFREARRPTIAPSP